MLQALKGESGSIDKLARVPHLSNAVPLSVQIPLRILTVDDITVNHPQFISTKPTKSSLVVHQSLAAPLLSHQTIFATPIDVRVLEELKQLAGEDADQ